MAKTPHGIEFDAYRPVVMARNGMVCAGHPLASQAGISILQKGGNAIDAAIATAAALNVVEPLMSGIGGDGFIMIYEQSSGQIQISNGTGAAPYGATLEHYQSTGIPQKGILSVSIPGLVHSWLDAHEKYGLLPLKEILSPAMDLAENGFPVTHYLAQAIASDRLLCEFPTSKAIFTKNDIPLKAGEILFQRNLAKTLNLIAEEGREAFYQGPIARDLVDFSNSLGGLLTEKDFRDCSARWQLPISTYYKGFNIYEAPPNSSGHVLLQELNILEEFDLSATGCNTSESIHLMVEAKKLAFLDREAYVADPDYINVPVEGLISKEYAKERAKLIDPDQASELFKAGDPWVFQTTKNKKGSYNRSGTLVTEQEDTTCFVVADQWGNAVCQLQSLQSAWGSSLVAGDTGILLNNRMTYWHLDANHVDCLRPGKRVRHTMNPVMVTRGRNLHLVLGTPGADTQVQSNMQVLSHIIDFGMTVSEAIEAPRWKSNQSPTESNIPHTCKNELLLEGRYSNEICAQLEKLGHAIRVVDAWDGIVGREMIIKVDPDNQVLHGAADPRYDGYTVGW